MKSQQRIKQTGEVFTPPELVKLLLDKLPSERWKDSDGTWLDPTCGDGAFLIDVKRRLIAEGHDEKHILDNMIYGVDYMEDNVKKCIKSLYGEGEINLVDDFEVPRSRKRDGFIAMFTHNGKLIEHIIQADGLKYDYNFDEDSHADGFFTL